MVKSPAIARYSSCFEVASIRPCPQPTYEERMQALERASFNSFCISQDKVYMDLRTDGASGALLSLQQMDWLEAEALESGFETAPENSPALSALTEVFQEHFGFEFIVPCNMGRSAERSWVQLRNRPGGVVPGNMLFWSIRYYIQSGGGKVEDVVTPRAFELFSDDPFKGNADPGLLKEVIERVGPENVPFIYLELCVNAGGGHPISLANLAQVKEIASSFKIPLYLDATRILENSQLIRLREAGCAGLTLAEIVKRTCAFADAITLSAQKDFAGRGVGVVALRDANHYAQLCEKTQLEGTHAGMGSIAALARSMPEILRNNQYAEVRAREIHQLSARLLEKGVPILRPPGGHAVFVDLKSFFPKLRPEQYPAQALAAYVYAHSGIRLAKGGSPTEAQRARGIDFLRITLPPNRYTQGHIDDLVAALVSAYQDREKITGMKKITKPGRPASFSEPFERPSWL